MTIQIRDVTVVPEGDGVDVKRLFPLHGFMNFDPFVLFDHFDIGAGCGFPDHPHRGFEAITYMFEGGMNHKDNLGNESFVTAGGAQRFTAGSGIVHSEMPAKDGKSIGIQLWINLPQSLKKIEPSYQQVNANEFPVSKINGVTIKNIVGNNSPLNLKTNVIYQHILFNEDTEYSLSLGEGMHTIVYVKQGEVDVFANNDTNKLDSSKALFIDNTDTLNFKTVKGSEIMICSGLPHNEPIHQHGPFVD